MQLRSLSIAVPTKGDGNNSKGCVNSCKFCVSSMDNNEYKDRITYPDYRAENDYLDCINFCLERNFESMVITGTGEPLVNTRFLSWLSGILRGAERRFRWIDIQTSGVFLSGNTKLYNHLRDSLRVKTVSLSLSHFFNSRTNADINGIPAQLQFNIDDLCKEIRSYGFNLRLSLNLWKAYNDIYIADIILKAKNLGATQITFRKLYTSKTECPQNTWIKENEFHKMNEYIEYIRTNGDPLEKVSFGATRYDVGGVSTLIDEDCMSQNVNDDVRYMVLRPDCHLYTKWGNKGSLLF